MIGSRTILAFAGLEIDASRASPNHGERKGDGIIRTLVLHYTGMPDAKIAIDWLCNPASEVSCHYVVEEDGKIWQLVPDDRRAWHAGRGSWRGETDINSHSIGIEIVNPGHEFGYRAFPSVQIDAVIALSRALVDAYAIQPRDVIAHSDLAPARKTDPGELFPWDRLATEGLGHYVGPEPLGDGRFFTEGDAGPPIEALQAMLTLYGYAVPVSGVFCGETKLVVAAFQRHFRPAKVDGVADASTITTLHRLLRALPTV